MKVIDMTRTMYAGMPVFPGDPSPNFEQTADIQTDGFREKMLSFASHTGTHMDAPSHVIPDGITLDAFPLTQFYGNAVVIPCEAAGTNGIIMLDTLTSVKGVMEADFLLLRTGWEKLWGQEKYFRGFPVLSEEAAIWIADKGKKGVGLDVMSIDPTDSETLPIHRIVLDTGRTVIIENLCRMDELPQGLFRFCAFPLKIRCADGAPVRAAAFLD